MTIVVCVRTLADVYQVGKMFRHSRDTLQAEEIARALILGRRESLSRDATEDEFVRPQVIHGWRSRQADFPKQIATLKTALIWDLNEVQRWSRLIDLVA